MGDDIEYSIYDNSEASAMIYASEQYPDLSAISIQRKAKLVRLLARFQ